MLIEENPEIVAAAPADFTAAERAFFSKLVREAGEVGGNALATNIVNAKTLIVMRHGGDIHGVAALKRPQASYRKRIGSKAGVDLSEANFRYELGYVFLLPEARGKRLSTRLVATALEQAEGAGVFATTRTDNAPMIGALAKAGFENAGQTFRGRDTRTIQVLVRPG